MHPDRGIVCIGRHTDGLSTRPDSLNTLTHQSNGTNYAPRDPLSRPCYKNRCPLDSSFGLYNCGSSSPLIQATTEFFSEVN